MKMSKRINMWREILILSWVLILACLICISLLIIQNIRMKKNIGFQRGITLKSSSMLFEEKLEENFLFKKFPIPLNPDGFHFQSDYPMPFLRYNLVMLFDFTVCGHCLHAQLALLKQYKEKFEDKFIHILAIIGTVNKREDTEIINMKASGEIFFPCKIIPVEQLYKTFGLNKEHFLDTPFYILTSHEAQIYDFLKPQYLETKELGRWLDILSRMEII